MKKTLGVLLVLSAIVVGCNKEKIYKSDLNGTWSVYKYILRNADKTAFFHNTYGLGYNIAFTESGEFVETITEPDTNIVQGTYSFKDNTEKIVLTNTYYTVSFDTLGDSILTPHINNRTFTIFNLTGAHVQLRNDSSELYMEKIVTE